MNSQAPAFDAEAILTSAQEDLTSVLMGQDSYGGGSVWPWPMIWSRMTVRAPCRTYAYDRLPNSDIHRMMSCVTLGCLRMTS
jgi:hypothetical protein